MELAGLLILAALLGWQKWSHDRQVQSLLDRIQFPQKVEAERTAELSTTPTYLPLEDDEAYEKAQANGEVR